MITSQAEDIIQRIQNIYSSCPEEEQHYLYQILQEFANTGESETYEKVWLADYIEIPVDIQTFLESDLFLGRITRNGKGVYPYWKKVMTDIFSAGNKYDENIFTGATRIGKTSTAITCVAYMLYRLMCLRNPQEFFGIKEESQISILFFNLTMDLAKGVAFREFNDTLKASPWFNQNGTFSRSLRDFYYIPNGGKVSIDYGSDSAHALGKQVFASVMDEVNFSRSGIKDVNKAKERMLDTYNTISARIKGTFRKNGEVYGKMFAVSSKKSDSDFLESHIQTQLASGAGDHIYVVDKPQWEILPPERFHKERFYIAVGDRHRKGFVIPDNQCLPDSLQELKDQGYVLMDPPIDMKPEFLADFEIALRDLAGVSVPGSLSFITQESLTAVINTKRRNPFINDILQIGMKDNFTIEEFFHLEYVDPSIKKAPLYIHLDLSLTTDRTGMSGCAATGRKEIEVEPGKTIFMPSYTHIFSVALQAPGGDKIPYSKIVAFLCWLRKQGFNIQVISRDQFQSEYLAQILEEQGFRTAKISLDRTPDGYMALRSVILEKRIDMLDCQLLQDELIQLQRDSVTGALDHPIGGSKDLGDSVAGCIWEAILDNPEPKPSIKKSINVISSVNGPRRSAYSNQLPSMFPNINNFNTRKR